jgi:hypothetical protein
VTSPVSLRLFSLWFVLLVKLVDIVYVHVCKSKKNKISELCLFDVATRIKNVCLIYMKDASTYDCVCRNAL